MSEQERKYTAADLKFITAREGIRLRPRMYLGSADQGGLHLLAGELVESGVAAHRYGTATTITCTLHQDDSFTIAHDGEGIPVIKHEHTGKSALEVVFTTIFAGGNSEWRASFLTAGFTITAALCKRCEVESRIDGHAWRIVFSEGNVVEPLVCLGLTSETGLRIRFLPDPKIFGNARFDGIRLRRELRECAALVPELRIVFRDETLGHDDEFHFPEGVQTLLLDMLPATALLKRPLHVRAQSNDIRLDFAAQYVADGATRVDSYVNLRQTRQQGTHVSGCLAGIKAAAQQISRAPRRKSGSPIVPGRVQSGLRAVVSLEIPHPDFEGAMREKLTNPEMKYWCEASVTTGLLSHFWDASDDMQRLLAHLQYATET